MERLNGLSLSRAKALFSESVIRATCGDGDVVGSCVYIDADATEGVYSVSTANPLDGAVKMPSVGIIVKKESDTSCVVRMLGLAKGVASGLIPGKPVFVGEAGALSQTPPIPIELSPLAYVQFMGVALSSDTVLLKPDFSIIKRIA